MKFIKSRFFAISIFLIIVSIAFALFTYSYLNFFLNPATIKDYRLETKISSFTFNLRRTKKLYLKMLDYQRLGKKAMVKENIKSLRYMIYKTDVSAKDLRDMAGGHYPLMERKVIFQLNNYIKIWEKDYKPVIISFLENPNKKISLNDYDVFSRNEVLIYPSLRALIKEEIRNTGLSIKRFNEILAISTISIIILILLLFYSAFKTDAEREKNEKKFRTMFYNNSLVMFMLDPRTLTILDVNDSAGAYYGYQRDEIIGKTLSETFNPFINSDEVFRNMKESREAGKKIFGGYRHRLKNGKIRDVEVGLSPFFLNEKQVLLVTVIDITAKKANEEKVKSLQSLYASLSEVNQIIVRTKNEEVLFTDICNKLVEKGLFLDAVLVLFDDNLNIKAMHKYRNSDYADFLLLTGFNSTEKRNSPMATSFLNRKIAINNNTAANVRMLPWRNEMLARGYLSSAAIPIVKKNKTIGSLGFLAGKQRFFAKETYELLAEMVMDINFALDKMEDERWHSMISGALDSGSDFSIICDKYFNIIYANESAYDMLGYSGGELLGIPYSRLFGGCPEKTGFIEKFLDSIVSGETVTDFFNYLTKDMQTLHSLVTITPFKTNGEIEYYVTVGKDISHEVEIEETLERLIYYDQITGLPNKKLLTEKIESFIKDSAYLENKSSALAIINPINFSFINHTFGFEVGSKVIAEIATRIGSAIKSHDIPARWDSDKFAVFFKNLKMDEDAIHIIGRVLENLGEVYTIGDKRLSVTFNAGISFYPKDAEDVQDIFNKAESALFNARTEGGSNSVRFFKKEFQDYARKRVELRNELKDALANDEFVIYYQPYFDVADGSVQGAEALLRWRKQGIIVPPMEFIPFLEESGFITEVEEWIIKDVTSKIKKRDENNLKTVPISINISPVSFRNQKIREKIDSIFAENNIEPSKINLEIVERTFIDDIKHSSALLHYLKGSGFGLSIDDFGTGYSSLSYLANLPFDFLKIDISFIRSMAADQHTAFLVETIIYLSRKLGLKSVAEGVETNEQWDMLKRMGCDYAQGYLFSRPVEYGIFEEFLSKEQ